MKLKNSFIIMIRIVLLFFIILLHSCVKSKSQEIETVSVEEMKTQLQYNSKPDIEIDSKDDFKKSNLVNADKIIESEKFRAELNILEKESPIAIYFTSEDKTQEAAKILNNLGFKQIYILNNGISKWSLKIK